MSLLFGLINGLKEVMNLFLDTTPRQWMHLIMEFCCALRLQMRGVFGVALTVSVLCHATLFVSGKISTVFKSIVSSSQASDTIDLKDKAALEQMLEQQKFIEIVGVYYLNGTEKPKKSTVSPDFMRLLKNMKNGMGSLNAMSRWSLKEASASVNKSDSKAPSEEKVDWSKATQDKRAQTSSNSKNLNREQSLIKTLHSYNSQFQSCYERSLLKDSTISGKIAFELTVGPTRRISHTNIDFEGQASESGLEQLKGCLEDVTSKVVLPTEAEGMSGKRIKFYVMLKSS